MDDDLDDLYFDAGLDSLLMILVVHANEFDTTMMDGPTSSIPDPSQRLHSAQLANQYCRVLAYSDALCVPQHFLGPFF